MRGLAEVVISVCLVLVTRDLRRLRRDVDALKRRADYQNARWLDHLTVRHGEGPRDG